MKGLLSFNASFLTAANIIAIVMNQNPINKIDSAYYIINWFEDGSSWMRQSKYSCDFTQSYFIKTINVRNFDISKYKTVSLLDPNKESCTKTIWKNKIYYGISLRDKLNNLLIKDVFTFNKKVETNKDINNYLTFKLLGITQLFSKKNVIQSSHYVGFSYYTENGNNYIQIFIVQYAVFFCWQWENGLMWTNVGRGLIFYL